MEEAPKKFKTPKQYREMEFRQLLVELTKLLKPKVYVEIGIKKCYTFNQISPLVDLAIGVDINESSWQYMEIAKENDIFLCMDSKGFAEWVKQYKPELKIDFLFIDGDHHHEAILDDIDACIGLLKPYESMVFLHDTYPANENLLAKGYCFDAWKAASFIRKFAKDDFEITTLPGPWAGMSILRFAPDYCHGWMEEDISKMFQKQKYYNERKTTLGKFNPSDL